MASDDGTSVFAAPTAPSDEAILRQAPAVIYVYDLSTETSIYQNRHLGELLGYTVGEDLEPSVNAWRALMHPDDQERFAAHRQAMRRLRPGETAVFEYRMLDAKGEWRWLVSRDAPLDFDARGWPLRIVGAMADATERRRAEERQELLLGELKHRVRNMLTVVSAIVSRTYRSDPGEGFLEKVLGRLHALAGAADLLVESEWAGASLRQVVWRTLDAQSIPHGRVWTSGPDLTVAPGEAMTLSLILNELATNAQKYGALSNAAGRVNIAWGWEPGDERSLRIAWREEGGPPVAPPTRAGFGSQLIERSASDPRTRVSLQFPPEGVACTIVLPVG